MNGQTYNHRHQIRTTATTLLLLLLNLTLATTGFGLSYPIVDTGQDECYDEVAVIRLAGSQPSSPASYVVIRTTETISLSQTAMAPSPTRPPV